jgi:hypothetical protein
MNVKTVTMNATALMMALAGASCSKYALDQKMAELCKKDGGVKVYETVTLSAAEYAGQLKFSTTASREDYYGPEYRFVEEYRVLVGNANDPDPEVGRGRLSRWYSAIYRRADGRLLGEAVQYGRTGGDGVTFGSEPSNSQCPLPRVSLSQSIFVEGK